MKRKDLSPDLGVDGKIILTVILKKQGVSVRVRVRGSGHDSVAAGREHGNEISRCTSGSKFLKQLSDY